MRRIRFHGLKGSAGERGNVMLLLALSLPLMYGRVPPNPLYGFRVPRTLRHPELWYPANAYSGRWLIELEAI